MGREDDVWLGLLWRSRVHVAASAFDGEFIGLVSQAAEFGVKNIADMGFVAGDRFNVYELTGQSDDIHGKENNARDGAQSFRTQDSVTTEA
jgi:hypothetical protein